jgi:hypothetical protein
MRKATRQSTRSKAGRVFDYDEYDNPTWIVANGRPDDGRGGLEERRAKLGSGVTRRA